MEPAPVRDKLDTTTNAEVSAPTWRSWFAKLGALLDRTPETSTGTAAPTSTPTKIGDVYCNTSTGDVYIATGISSSSDWKILN